MDYSNLGNELSSAVEQLSLWFYFRNFILPIFFFLFMVFIIFFVIKFNYKIDLIANGKNYNKIECTTNDDVINSDFKYSKFGLGLRLFVLFFVLFFLLLILFSVIF